MDLKEYKFKGGWGKIKIEAPTKEIANNLIKKLMIIPIPKLLELGFTEVQSRFEEPEFSYDLHSIDKNESYISVTTTYNLKGVITGQYFDFNDRTLKGDPIGEEDLKFLIKLM